MTETAAGRQYWAFLANPNVYRILDAVHDLPVDTWTAPNGDIRRGDRVLIWKARGSDQDRGVVALGEVLTDPAPMSDAGNPYWLVPPAPDDIRRSVRVRYMVPPGLPLYVGGPADAVLRQLSVSRGQGTRVFYVDELDWLELVQAAGGWPEEPVEVEEAHTRVAELAGRRVAGQGRRIAPEVRKAIEDYAMAQAQAYLSQKDWSWEDVSRDHPYDLRCTDPSGVEWHVEVKGTTSEGAEVLLTPNEVRHARDQHVRMVLFVLTNVHVEWGADGMPEAGGGVPRVIEPWDIDPGDLNPVGYAYSLPRHGS